MTKNIINIGLPSKGRLKHDTVNIFKKKKLNIYSERGERDLFGYIKKLPNVKIIYLHARECIEQLSLGNIDIGFSGYDLFKESGINIQKKILIRLLILFLFKLFFEVIKHACDLSISPSFKILKLLAFNVVPVLVISDMISAVPVNGATSVLPRL